VNKEHIPVVLCFSGSDPTGGAGIQADIEAIASQGVHAAPVITAVTAQDTRNVIDFAPIPPDLVIQQARAVLEDMPVAAIKIGMIGNAHIAHALHTLLRDYPDIPVVYDPVFSAEGGGQLSQPDLIDAVRTEILPLTKLLTPNIFEVHALAPGSDTPSAAALGLLETRCEHILLTGTHGKTLDVEHILFGNHRELKKYTYKRLPYKYHGCGCTLAASITALLAVGLDLNSAVHHGLDYTYKTLVHARRIGMGQLHPNRFFWLDDEDEDDEDSETTH
jgi:hydroxymethylpyrimidine/phosphomethylpyrimidine kinase